MLRCSAPMRVRGGFEFELRQGRRRRADASSDEEDSVASGYEHSPRDVDGGLEAEMVVRGVFVPHDGHGGGGRRVSNAPPRSHAGARPRRRASADSPRDMHRRYTAQHRRSGIGHRGPDATPRGGGVVCVECGVERAQRRCIPCADVFCEVPPTGDTSWMFTWFICRHARAGGWR